MLQDYHPPQERAARRHSFFSRHSLSTKLLILTILFVLVTQVLILMPMVARYRYEWLRIHIDEALIVSLAADPDPYIPDRTLSETEIMLHDYVKSYAIAVRQNNELIVFPDSDMPPVIADRFDLMDTSYFTLIKDAFAVFFYGQNRIIEVISVPPWDDTMSVSLVMNESSLYGDLISFTQHLIVLTFLFSLLVAALIYYVLNRGFIDPMRAMTRSLTAFYLDPHDPKAIMIPSRRNDELGIAQHELANMQAALLTALRQKERLATLGTAVAKINHDLSNILQSAVLISERLIKSDDPEVVRVLPRLILSLDRATELCSQILSYSRDGVFPLHRSRFSLAVLVDEVGADLLALQRKYITERKYPQTAYITWTTQVAPEMLLFADRDQLSRSLMNLGKNALQARATHIDVTAETEGDYLRIIVSDNGSGLSPGVREDLFQPFATTVRVSGTGLGLAIAREILRAHGGDLRLLDPITMTISASTAFVLELPADVVISK